MSPFDLLLMSVGALLTLVGVYLFASGKMRDKASRVEAFGIKLDVTNPSLILILAGVGLMLVPRFVPEPMKPQFTPPSADVAPQAPPTPPATTSSVPPPAPVPVPTSTPTQTPAPDPAPTPAPVPKPATAPKPSPAPQTGTTSAPAARPASPRPTPPVVPVKPVTEARPQTQPAIQLKPAPQAAESAPAPGTPSAAPAAPTPRYLVAALGTPNPWKSFWDKEEEAGYSLKLARTARERLRRHVRDAQVEALSEASGVTPLMQDEVTRRRRCEAGGFTALVVFTVAQPQVVISSVESAFWPELVLLHHDCQDGQARRETRQLAPRVGDRYPFETELAEHLDRQFRERL